MRDISFLTGTTTTSPQSVDEAIYQLENASVIFLSSWQTRPQDITRAARASREAMVHLDHIVNEVMRARDHLKSNSNYVGSQLKNLMDTNTAKASMPVTREEQANIAALGPGNGSLPNTGLPLSMEKLLNKIKHRRHDYANFRIGPNGEHIFVITADKPNQQPDSIVEFVISDFCKHCMSIAAVI
ncbi:TPA: hypothetical protein NG238_004387 [Vibrio parahaemolyticus]|nr:hypothetical protein [Vibrio parahaemolyticus]HCE3000222.1 hypothetical protein [Vibrio parahaemolyticus]